MVDGAISVRRFYGDVKTGDYDLLDLVGPFVDFASAMLVLVYIVLMFLQKASSAKESEKILGGLERIPWSSPNVDIAAKTESFFSTIAGLMKLIKEEAFNNVLCNIILLVNLLRVIQCTSLHPRLALLTGTVANAADDLWHTALLTCLLMLCFAGIGTWRFGNTLEEFGTFERTLQTEFEMLFGGFSPNWASDPQLPRELQAFVVLYLMILFLLVLNFLLAIIVEAYMKVREGVASMNCEGEFCNDVAVTVSARVLTWIKGLVESLI